MDILYRLWEVNDGWLSGKLLLYWGDMGFIQNLKNKFMIHSWDSPLLIWEMINRYSILDNKNLKRETFEGRWVVSNQMARNPELSFIRGSSNKNYN